MGRKTTQTVLTPVKILDSNEGGHSPFDLRDYKGQCDLTMYAKSDAGSSPTLDLKIQESDISLSGLSYEVSDDTATEDVELREGASTNIKIIATVTTSEAIQVESVGLMLKKNGTVSETDLTLTIEGDSSGDPDESAIGTATTSTDNIGSSYQLVKFTFSDPIELSESTTYHLVLSSDYAASGTNNIAWQAESGLSSGGNQVTNNGSAYSADADDSMVFNLYQYLFTDVSGVSFSQITTLGSIETITLDIDSLKRYIRPHSSVGGSSTPAFYAGLSITGFKEN